MKKKLKRFFALRRNADGGFTLVELIVVIAILAILAGVAVPAYNGYIKKANQAADEQLLAAVNKAFAAACAVESVDHYNAGANDPAIEDGKLGEITVNGVPDFNAVFENFFDTEGEFKVITKLFYNGNIGGFAENAEITYTDANGVVYKASASDIAKYQATTWAANLSSEEILQMVASVADSVQEGYSEKFQDLVESDAFEEAAAAALGVSKDEYGELYEDMRAELQAKYKNQGMSNKDAKAAAEKELNSNIAVLVSANRAQEAGSTILSTLKENGGQDAKDKINANLAGDSTLGFSEAALAYGLYNSYIYSKTDLTTEEKQEQSDPVHALSGGFEDPDFQKYLDSDQAQKDLEGLLAAMNVISSQDTDTASSVVMGGLASDEMIGAMNGILGG